MSPRVPSAHPDPSAPVSPDASGAGLRLRPAEAADEPVLRALMDAAITELQRPWLSAAQVEASRLFMGLDRQLIADGTYVVVERDGVIIGCGGWSRRATLYGGDHSAGRDARLLDPATEPARTRAMYTHPAHVRQGVGRRILAHCETAAAAEGFRTMELMATMAGVPLYLASGYAVVDEVVEARGAVPVPMRRMRKPLG